MKTNNYFQLIGIVFFFSVIHGCDTFDVGVKIINTSDNLLYYKWMSDSSYNQLFKEIIDQKESFNEDSIILNRYFIVVRPKIDTIEEGIPGTWEEYFAKPNRKIWVFIIPDSLMSQHVGKLTSIQYQIKRKFFDKTYLLEHNGIIDLSD